MTFLALLAIALGVLSTLGLVLVGLVEMPWPLLLVGLLAALYGFQRLVDMGSEGGSLMGQPEDFVAQVTQPDPPSATADLETSNQGEELIYRGVRYRVNSRSQPDDLRV
jgi:hypothetical protein